MRDERRPLRIAYLTALDPKDRRSWSGTIYSIGTALEKHCGEVHFVGPIKSWQKRLGKLLHWASKHLLKKGFEYNHSFLLARTHAKFAAHWLANHEVDLIVSTIGATETAFLDTTLPIVLVGDATFHSVLNYYPQFTRLLSTSVRQGETIEQFALNKARLLLYSSEWAAQSAIRDYHIDPDKVRVVPFGANFDAPPDRSISEQRVKSGQCKLLFIAVQWDRKGGEIAYETLQQLEKLGIEAELTVCGCVPPARFAHKRLKVIPFLNKNDPEQHRRLVQLFIDSDFMLLPTRSDCTPISFCEASAYGLPVITTSTGGVPGVITEGENGFMLPLEARGDAYARLVAEIYNDDPRYAELVKSSRAAFEMRLNWDAWGKAVGALLAETLSPDRAQTSSDVAAVSGAI